MLKLTWEHMKMPIAAIGWLVTLLMFIVISYDSAPLYIYFLFGGLAVLFFTTSDRVAFFYFITLVLMTVFYFLFLAFKDGWQPYEQGIAIGLHFIFLLHLFSLYSLSKYMYQMGLENKMLVKRVEQLEDYVLEEGILTRREFEKQATFVLSNMKRRKETGFYIKISLAKEKRTVRRKLLLMLADMSYTTFRKNYDLVGKYDEKTLVILVQNTNEQGLEIVMNRLNKLMAERLEEKTIQQMGWTVSKIDGEQSLDETAVLT